jgi:hypothetical protein
MQRPLRALLACALIALPAAASAAPAAQVEALTMPAWVTRSGTRQPLGPGMALQKSDEIATAPGSRVLLRLGDGSAVKLGENARFVIATAAPREDGVFRATLRVLEGAFRFTTSALAKAAVRREVDIALPTVTAGIRGTDLWGKAAPGRDFVVLIEGRIAITRGNEPEVAMDQALSVFDAPAGAPTPPLGAITPEELAKLATETELREGAGTGRSGGAWKVQVAAPREQAQALKAWDQLRAAGYGATLAPKADSEGTVYRVRVPQLASKADAATLAKRLASDLGFSGAFATR